MSQPPFDLESGTQSAKNSRKAAQECSPGYEVGNDEATQGRKIGCDTDSAAPTQTRLALSEN